MFQFVIAGYQKEKEKKLNKTTQTDDVSKVGVSFASSGHTKPCDAASGVRFLKRCKHLV